MEDKARRRRLKGMTSGPRASAIGVWCFIRRIQPLMSALTTPDLDSGPWEEPS
jgi:hypothetical protein